MIAVLDVALSVLIAVLLLGGGFWMLTAALSMFNARDAYSRVNVLSPATGLGMPMIVVGAFLQHTRIDGLEPGMLVKTLLTVLALIIVSSVASNVLARAAYLSAAPVDPRTSPQDLARPPEEGEQVPHSDDR
ncbi:MAG: cation:proton antiporter [Dermabacteraceae bacterium]|uniref:cation:proton antiporter n=1 Tax=Brachybacterium sp. TaxID=1891286 RepID=UPI00264E0D81|nr:monovalent cation/H(+) antiporter subunit G [Brachybacterium sp.]MDN6328451.1 monovalent cation/H(+) antiporter subunit G [Brachybacterium sp.]